MMTEIRDAVIRNSGTLAQDLIGASALAVVLVAGLYLPVFV